MCNDCTSLDHFDFIVGYGNRRRLARPSMSRLFCFRCQGRDWSQTSGSRDVSQRLGKCSLRAGASLESHMFFLLHLNRLPTYGATQPCFYARLLVNKCRNSSPIQWRTYVALSCLCCEASHRSALCGSNYQEVAVARKTCLLARSAKPPSEDPCGEQVGRHHPFFCSCWDRFLPPTWERPSPTRLKLPPCGACNNNTNPLFLAQIQRLPSTLLFH